MVWTTNATNHISKQKMLQTSSHMTATWRGSPEETQNESKECLPSSCQLLQTRPTVHSGNSGWENTGHWAQIADEHLKGMTAVSPDSASSHTERTSLVAQMVKASAYNAGDLGSIPGLGRCPGEGNGSTLQYSCLENPTQRRLAGYSPWGHEESDTIERLHFHFHAQKRADFINLRHLVFLNYQ